MWRWLASFLMMRDGRSDEEEDTTAHDRLQEQDQAWQLLTQLMALDPERRPSAAEALLGSYLNSDCSEAEVLTSAPEPWTLRGLGCALGVVAPGKLVSEECNLSTEPL